MLIKINLDIIDEHSELTEDDRCFYMREYFSNKGYSGGRTNSLILNFKKEPSKRKKPEWKYKTDAIIRFAKDLRGIFNCDDLKNFVFVPIPPSKSKDHELYDDRLIRVLKLLGKDCPHFEMRELITCRKSHKSFHSDPGHRLDLKDLVQILEFDGEQAQGIDPNRRIILFDDIITNGTHFKACQSIIESHLPNLIRGLFLARRANE